MIAASSPTPRVAFPPSWAYPKPSQEHVPILVGAGGTDRTFRWIAAHADGWITPPRDTELDDQLELLHKLWSEAGRTGRPYVVALGGRADPDRVTAGQQRDHRTGQGRPDEAGNPGHLVR